MNTINNLLGDIHSLQTLPQIWPILARCCGETLAVRDPRTKPEIQLTYQELLEKIQYFAAGLQGLGVKPTAKVALFGDNSPRWLIADQGILTAGAVNVVRSASADRQELLYILKDSDSTALVIEDRKTLEKLQPELADLPISLIVLLADEAAELAFPMPCLNFSQVLATGANRPLTPETQGRDSLATLLYTSGTTGRPKGVMLSHGNLLYEIAAITAIIKPQVGDRVLSILPSWHAYERTCEYFLFSRGCTQIYTNLRAFKKDLQTFQPHYMIGVPRLWESVYEGIQKQLREQPPRRQHLIQFFLSVSQRYILARRLAQNLSLEHLDAPSSQRLLARFQAALLSPLHWLGDRLIYRQARQGVGGQIQALISGGGALARHVDDFFELIGIPLLVGYGLTETAPVTNARTLSRNLRGSAGRPLPGTEIRIVDPDSRQPLALGDKGLVLIRGPEVMQAYYKLPEATAKAIDSEGWFDSGDLGWVTPDNDLVLTGRAKDTIVLSNGENIEPQPLEDACSRSPYIDQIMVVGQDRRSLGALIVPNREALQHWAEQQNLKLTLPPVGTAAETLQDGDSDRQSATGPKVPLQGTADLYSQPVRDLFRQELNREVKNRPGYRLDDRIGPFVLIIEPFSVENGMMTQTLKIKRPVVSDRYRDLINSMFE